MTREQRTYLAGYAQAARELSQLSATKGSVKIILRIWRQQPIDDRFLGHDGHGRGYIDAHLDAVGC